jgi:hypothetical protein
MKVNGGKAIVPNVIKAVDIARQRGILVVWVGTGYPFFLARFFISTSYPILLLFFVSLLTCGCDFLGIMTIFVGNYGFLSFVCLGFPFLEKEEFGKGLYSLGLVVRSRYH